MASSKKEVLRTSGPVTILEILKVVDENKSNPKKALLAYIKEQIEQKSRTIRKDTAIILEGRGFTKEEIPLLANKSILPTY